MQVRQEHRERVVAALASHLLATGLSQISLRQLAKAAGVSDRMLLYYFTDKAEVMATAMAQVAEQLASALAVAMPEGDPLPPQELIRRATALTTRAPLRAYLRLWVEVVAATARREEPFVAISAEITRGFMTWVDARLMLAPGANRQAACAAVIAMVDGMAMFDVSSGADSANEVVDALGTILSGN